MKQCLVIDDSRVIRKVVRRIVEGLHFDVEEAGEITAAFDLCRENMPEAILLDWNMPNASGVEFLRRLRRAPGGDKPVIVVYTTENDLEDITVAIGAGANEYFLKPFDQNTVQAKLAELGLG